MKATPKPKPARIEAIEAFYFAKSENGRTKIEDNQK